MTKELSPGLQYTVKGTRMPTLEMDSLSVSMGSRSKSIRGLCGFAIRRSTASDFTPIASGARRSDARAILISLPAGYYDAVVFAFDGCRLEIRTSVARTRFNAKLAM